MIERLRIWLGRRACRRGDHWVFKEYRTEEATRATAQTLPGPYGPTHHVMFTIVKTCGRPGCRWTQLTYARGTIS